MTFNKGVRVPETLFVPLTQHLGIPATSGAHKGDRVAVGDLLGGATFPIDVKFSPTQDKTFEALAVNGAECEPYLTCDHRVMVEKTESLMV
ncbi:MAG: hypothetical protein PF508_01740 [Spirochaeta sp.]|nr:hypothetical protein [Spirochaeta sp.]